MNLLEKIKIGTLFDSHAHFAQLADSELEGQIRRSLDTNVSKAFSISTNIANSKVVVEQKKQFPEYLEAFVGIDPEIFELGSELFVGLANGEEYIDKEVGKLKQLVIEYKEYVFGIGEIGLDHHHLELSTVSEDEKEESKRLQEILFRKQLEVAKEFDLPVSIHSRKAEDKCLEIVKEFEVGGIFHSYTGSYETAAKILDCGLGLGVNGIVTFKKAEELRFLYKRLLGKIPPDPAPDYFYNKSIYFETDAPFLSPEGKRGEVNEPANIKLIFESFVNSLKN